MSIEQQLENYLHTQCQQGKFTHFFCACGFLNGQEKFNTSHLPTSSIFDLASITKALVVLPLLVHERQVGMLPAYESSLRAWLPEDKQKHLSPGLLSTSIALLLTHRSGLPAWRNFWLGILPDKTLTEKDQHTLLKRHAQKTHTAKTLYSDLNFILLGHCLEQVKNKKLNEIFAEFLQRPNNVFTPRRFLGFKPTSATVPTGFCHLRAKFLSSGEVYDENCAAWGGVSGHAGLFADGNDLVAYLRWLFSSQLGKEIVQRNLQMLEQGANTCLFGMQRADGVSSHVFADSKAMGHMGFTGGAFWLEPTRLAYAVFLTNRTIAGRVSNDFHLCRKRVFADMWQILR